ncbi:MAG: hypothetical protein SGCHY_001471 [Lobulomycetales sp.]
MEGDVTCCSEFGTEKIMAKKGRAKSAILIASDSGKSSAEPVMWATSSVCVAASSSDEFELIGGSRGIKRTSQTKHAASSSRAQLRAANRSVSLSSSSGLSASQTSLKVGKNAAESQKAVKPAPDAPRPRDLSNRENELPAGLEVALVKSSSRNSGRVQVKIPRQELPRVKEDQNDSPTIDDDDDDDENVYQDDSSSGVVDESVSEDVDEIISEDEVVEVEEAPAPRSKIITKTAAPSRAKKVSASLEDSVVTTVISTSTALVESQDRIGQLHGAPAASEKKATSRAPENDSKKRIAPSIPTNSRSKFAAPTHPRSRVKLMKSENAETSSTAAASGTYSKYGISSGGVPIVKRRVGLSAKSAKPLLSRKV